MFCPKCGQQNPDEAKFCGKCGATVSIAAAPPTPPPAPATAQGVASSTTAVSQAMKIGMIIASIIVPIAGIVVGIVFLNDANPEKKAAGKQWLIIGIVAGVIWTLLFTE